MSHIRAKKNIKVFINSYSFIKDNNKPECFDARKIIILRTLGYIRDKLVESLKKLSRPLRQAEKYVINIFLKSEVIL